MPRTEHGARLDSQESRAGFGVLFLMRGIVEFRNPVAARYGVRTETGHYTAFQLLSSGLVLDTGEEVIDELDEQGVHSVRAGRRGAFNVFVEMTRRTRDAVRVWVETA
jgi:hypothetical protein